MSSRNLSLACIACLLVPLAAFAQGGGGGGGGSGGGGSAGTGSTSTGIGAPTGPNAQRPTSMQGSAGTGNTSTGIGASTGASSQNTVGQTNSAISPANPTTTQPGGPNAQPAPRGVLPTQNPQTFDPRLSPGYQK